METKFQKYVTACHCMNQWKLKNGICESVLMLCGTDKN